MTKREKPLDESYVRGTTFSAREFCTLVPAGRLNTNLPGKTLRGNRVPGAERVLLWHSHRVELWELEPIARCETRVFSSPLDAALPLSKDLFLVCSRGRVSLLRWEDRVETATCRLLRDHTCPVDFAGCLWNRRVFLYDNFNPQMHVLELDANDRLLRYYRADIEGSGFEIFTSLFATNVGLHGLKPNGVVSKLEVEAPSRATERGTVQTSDAWDLSNNERWTLAPHLQKAHGDCYVFTVNEAQIRLSLEDRTQSVHQQGFYLTANYRVGCRDSGCVASLERGESGPCERCKDFCRLTAVPCLQKRSETWWEAHRRRIVCDRHAILLPPLSFSKKVLGIWKMWRADESLVSRCALELAHGATFRQSDFSVLPRDLRQLVRDVARSSLNRFVPCRRK